MSVGAGAVYQTDMAGLCLIQSTVSANSQSQQALSATVRGLGCHVASRPERERGEKERQGGVRGSEIYEGGTAANRELEGVEFKRFLLILHAHCTLHKSQ